MPVLPCMRSLPIWRQPPDHHSDSTVVVLLWRAVGNMSEEPQTHYAFDMWALHKILWIPYTRHVTNMEVRATTGCRPLSHLVTDRRLRLFGHIARSSPQEDHHRAVAAVIWGLTPDWKRPLGRPSHTWLRAVEADLGQQNIGLASAWRKAAIRDDWRRIVDTAMLQWSMQ